MFIRRQGIVLYSYIMVHNLLVTNKALVRPLCTNLKFVHNDQHYMLMNNLLLINIK